ncbi:Tubulin-specific chaperone D [Grifola frondosa]|uniref:Tubulin-specific chaperone D n=1 Tax=Grifola frondosa TaxID=5627 RepID=A0A1C7M3U4_GRIFR|nr:Tubulin-specific chaperone D [Grifola frondosa]
MLLGVLDYSAHPHGILQAIRCLLRCADRSSHGGSMTIEARRNAYNSMPQILLNVAARLPEHLSPTDVCQMIDALQDGLRDYTTDERGDVGSWIRVTCVKGLTLFIETLFAHAHMLPNFAGYFPPEKFHSAIGGILKQGIERLDNVRQQAGESFLRLLLLSLPSVPDAEQWRICGDAKMKGLFLSGNETIGWNEGAWLFPKAVHLLDIKEYREAVLSGLILSASTKTDSTQRPVTSSLVAYDLLAQASRNVASNNVVIPVLQTFNILLEADAFERLPQDPAGLQCLRTLLALVSRNVPRLKNPQRILMSMKIVVNLLPISELRSDCIVQLTDFLIHQYPKIRADTAEHLYLMLESKDLGYENDEAEDIILETEWSSGDLSVVEAAAQHFISLLHEHTT